MQTCEMCKRQYDPKDEDARRVGEPHGWDAAATCCLACWLGVGPVDFPEAYPDQEQAQA